VALTFRDGVFSFGQVSDGCFSARERRAFEQSISSDVLENPQHFHSERTAPSVGNETGGRLIVGNASVQFHDPNDAKASFSFPVTDLGSLEQRHGPEGFRVLRIKLQNGKHFDLVPDVVGKSNTIPGENRKNDLTKRMDEGVTAMEKAIRDLAAENKVALK